MIAAPADAAPAADADQPPHGWPHSPAQWRIARRLAQGLSTNQIARSLDLSFKTVESQLGRLSVRIDGRGTRRERIVALVDTLTRAA